VNNENVGEKKMQSVAFAPALQKAIPLNLPNVILTLVEEYAFYNWIDFSEPRFHEKVHDWKSNIAYGQCCAKNFYLLFSYKVYQITCGFLPYEWESQKLHPYEIPPLIIFSHNHTFARMLCSYKHLSTHSALDVFQHTETPNLAQNMKYAIHSLYAKKRTKYGFCVIKKKNRVGDAVIAFCFPSWEDLRLLETKIIEHIKKPNA
jgi:hypothetical protein